MQWSEVVAAAKAINWIAYLGTADAQGDPHVCVVAPGFTTEGRIWFATRPSTKNIKNLRQNARIGMHWPVGGSGPGELFLRGKAVIHDPSENRSLWETGVVGYDMAGFWEGPDDPDLIFVEVSATYASLVDGTFTRHRWRP